MKDNNKINRLLECGKVRNSINDHNKNKKLILSVFFTI